MLIRTVSYFPETLVKIRFSPVPIVQIHLPAEGFRLIGTKRILRLVIVAEQR